MKVADDLFEKLSETAPQILYKFGISIGYSSPYGCFLSKRNDFVLFETEDSLFYIIQANFYEWKRRGIGVKIETDLDQSTSRISDFLINFHLWLKEGKIKIYEEKKYKNWTWKPVGDGRYDIERKEGIWIVSYCAYLHEFEEADKELMNHISKEDKNDLQELSRRNRT